MWIWCQPAHSLNFTLSAWCLLADPDESKRLFPGMSDPCFRNADKFYRRVSGRSQPDFCFSRLSQYDHFDSSSFSRRLARRRLSRSFAPLQRSHQLTHSLQHTLELLWEGRSVSCLSLLPGAAPSHPFVQQEVIVDSVSMLVNVQSLAVTGWKSAWMEAVNNLCSFQDNLKTLLTSVFYL